MWVAYGTALGAVRHKGFIPWDDDFDVAMPRPDYEKFVKEFASELPTHLKFVTLSNTPEFTLPFAKIQDSRRDVVEAVEKGIGRPMPQGVYIDIRRAWLCRKLYPPSPNVDFWIIPREDYLRWLREFRDKPIVKVVTGLRRSGKSTILDLFMRELVDSGVAERHVKDNYPKYIFTLDQVFVPDHEGVKTISVYDFLLGDVF